MKTIIAALFFLPIVLFGQKTFTLGGKVGGLPEASVVSLTDANNPTDTVSRGLVSNGIFELKGSVPEPNLYQLNFDGVQKKALIFLSNDSIVVKGDIGFIQQLSITGSATHDDFMQFQQIFNPLFQELTQIAQQINSQQGANRDTSLMTNYNRQKGKISVAVNDFVIQHKLSPVAPFLLVVTSELEENTSLLEKRYDLLDEKMKSGFYGKMVTEYLNESRHGAIGSEALDFSQPDPEGKPVSLNSFRGKYLLVDFWASWCRPCRMENPNVVSAFNKFKDKNFTVLGISLDRSKTSWLQAIKDDSLAWTQVSDLKFWNNEVAVKYNIQSIPQNILIDPSGKIVAKNLRGPSLHDKLCELLGCE